MGKKLLTYADTMSPEDLLPPGEKDKYKDMTFEQTLVKMANDRKVSLAQALLMSVEQTGDTSGMKLLQTAMEKQEGGGRELPITHERFEQIMSYAAERLGFVKGEQHRGY